MRPIEFISNAIGDTFYTITCWLQSKTEAFNMWAGALLAMFIYFFTLGILIFPPIFK